MDENAHRRHEYAKPDNPFLRLDGPTHIETPKTAHIADRSADAVIARHLGAPRIEHLSQIIGGGPFPNVADSMRSFGLLRLTWVRLVPNVGDKRPRQSSKRW